MQINSTSSIILNKLLIAYKKYQLIQNSIPKINRYSLGIKIDTYFINIMEMINYAQFGEKKLIYLEKAIIQNNVLKSLLTILFEINSISQEKYLEICKDLEEFGKMIFTWKLKAKNKTINHDMINGNKKSI
jgi:hypothetical protein